MLLSRGDGNHFRFAVVQVNEIEKKCKKPLDKFQKYDIIKKNERGNNNV